jgi:hypothetical protein
MSELVDVLVKRIDVPDRYAIGHAFKSFSILAVCPSNR